jgi:integrase
MNNHKRNTHNNVTSLAPFQKSPTAFLMEGLDKLDAKDKPYHVEVWDFSTSHTVGVRYRLTMSFRATKPEYVNGIQDALYKMYHDYKDKSSTNLKVGHMHIIKYGLQHIADCLGSTEWRNLENNRELKSFLRQLKQKKLNPSAIQQVLRSFNKLTECGAITFLIDSKVLMRCASSRESKQTVAIPHRLYQRILSRALEVVETYHPYRHDISDVMSQAYDIQDRVKSGERLTTRGRGHGRDELSMLPSAIEQRVAYAIKCVNHDIPDFDVRLDGVVLSDILVCCLIVTQGFSGVRIGEAASFNANSADEIIVNSKKVTVLTGETSKGNNAKPKTVTWQSHPVAKAALELAYDMMAANRALYQQGVDEKERQGETKEKINHMRRQLESAFLVPNATRQAGDNYIFNPKHAVKKFIRNLDYKATTEDVEEFNMLNPTLEGELKVGGTYSGLSSHDFRRTFAVFFVRYGFGTASGIKFQFKHENINMSGYYANNAELAQMNDLLMDEEILEELKEAGIDLGVDIFDEIINQSEHLSGAKGEAIMQDRMKRLEAGESIFMTREEIEENLRRGNFHIMQLPSGAYCTNGSCDRVCGTLLFRAEIKECEHKVVTDKGAKLIAKQRDRLIAKFTNLNTGDPLKSSILTGLKQKIQVEELTLKAHEVPYKPFNDDIILNSAG